jgi:hypothetical protein
MRAETSTNYLVACRVALVARLWEVQRLEGAALHSIYRIGAIVSIILGVKGWKEEYWAQPSGLVRAGFDSS